MTDRNDGHEDEVLYLACPYTDDSELVRQVRFEAATRKAAELIRGGLVVFSPLTHSRPMERYGLPTDWEFWEPVCRAMLSRCTSMGVLRMPGWDKSLGVGLEMGLAGELGIPMSMLEP